jgi:hypothetical protein
MLNPKKLVLTLLTMAFFYAENLLPNKVILANFFFFCKKNKMSDTIVVNYFSSLNMAHIMHFFDGFMHRLSKFMVYVMTFLCQTNRSRLHATIQCGISMPDNANLLCYCYALNAEAPHSVIKLPKNYEMFRIH